MCSVVFVCLKDFRMQTDYVLWRIMEAYKLLLSLFPGSLFPPPKLGKVVGDESITYGWHR